MSDSGEAKIFEKKGMKYNGFRIPWPFIAAFIALVGNAAVIQYKVQGSDGFQKDVIVRLDEISRKQGRTAREAAVTATRVENLMDTIRYHRIREHNNGPARGSDTLDPRGGHRP